MSQKTAQTAKTHIQIDDEEKHDAYIRKLKIVVIALGICLIVGFGLLVYAILTKKTDDTNITPSHPSSKVNTSIPESELTQSQITQKLKDNSPVQLEYQMLNQFLGNGDYPPYDISYTNTHIFIKIEYLNYHEILIYNIDNVSLVGKLKLHHPQ